jgi:hypothetical protein
VRKQIIAWSAGFFCLGVLLTLLGVSVVAKSFVRPQAWQSAALNRERGQTDVEIKPVPPWGTIEFLKIPLINPDDFFPDQPQRLAKPLWVFEDFSEGLLKEFFESCGLGPATRQLLLDRKFWNIGLTNCTVSPPDEVIWSLSPQARQKIYSTLAKSSANYPQYFAFRFPIGTLETRLRENGVAGSKIELVRKLVYSDLGCEWFADLQALQPHFTQSEFGQLVGALYQAPAYRLRLRVWPDSDVGALVKYWGRGGREKRIKPLLDSLAHVPGPGGATTSISLLFPTFARLRLYTFPDASEDPTATKQDCFFTSLNFFNTTPDMKFLDTAYAQRVIETEFEPIEDAPRFGDLVLLVDSKQQGIHCCVYVAADFVFTKNGVNNLQPWVLMKLSDVTAYYPTEQGRIVIMRRKDADLAPASVATTKSAQL